MARLQEGQTEDVPGNPVDGDAFHAGNIVLHHRLQLRAVDEDLVDLVCLHVREVDEVVGDVEVQRHEILEALGDAAVAVPLQGHLAQIIAVGEH